MGHNRIEFLSYSVQDTELLGQRVGRSVRNKDVLALEGDLGSGKTAFVRGLAKGIGVPDSYGVTSPTYALIHTYPGPIKLYHVDLYRISGEDDAENIGLFEFLGVEGVCAVEWARRLSASVWPDHLNLRFDIGEKMHRTITMTAHGKKGKSLLNRIRELSSITRREQN